MRSSREVYIPPLTTYQPDANPSLLTVLHIHYYLRTMNHFSCLVSPGSDLINGRSDYSLSGLDNRAMRRLPHLYVVHQCATQPYTLYQCNSHQLKWLENTNATIHLSSERSPSRYTSLPWPTRMWGPIMHRIMAREMSGGTQESFQVSSGASNIASSQLEVFFPLGLIDILSASDYRTIFIREPHRRPETPTASFASHFLTPPTACF